MVSAVIKNSKKILTVLLCLTLLLSVLTVAPTALAASDAMEATVWEDFSTYGGEVKKKQVRCTEEEGFAQTTDDLGAIGGVKTLKLGYTSLRGYHLVGGDQGFQVFFDKPKSLAGMDAIMLYVKMPLSRADDQGNNWGKSGFAPMLYVGDNIYTQIKGNQTISYLPVNSSQWRTTQSFGLYIDLPSGFEGYVKIPLDHYKSDMLTDDIRNHSAEFMIFQFSSMGAQCGSAYINAIYGVSNDTNSVMVRLNGDTTPRFLLSGATLGDIAPQKTLLEKAMKAEILQDFSGYPVGYDLISNGMATIQNKPDATATLCESVGGFFGTPSVKLSAKTYGGFHDVDPFYDIHGEGMRDISNMKAFLFYIKCAAPHPQKPSCSSIRFNLHTEKDGEQTWTLLGDSKILAMEKGTGVWKSYAAAGDGNGIVDLPANFEGYVMVKVEDMLTNPIADDMEGRIFLTSTMQFQAVGGECGDGYIGPLYMITEMEDKNNKLVTFDGCDVFSIATDSYATENDLLNIGPVVDRIYDAFPLSTCDLYPVIRAVTKESAIVEWQPTENAVEYRVDVYTEDYSTGSFAYLCTHSLLSGECALKLVNLKEAAHYYVTIVATDGSGMELATYNHQSFSTRQDSTEYQQQMITHSTTVDAENTGLSESTVIMIAVAGATVLIAAAAVGIVLYRKRKVRAQK